MRAVTSYRADLSLRQRVGDQPVADLLRVVDMMSAGRDNDVLSPVAFIGHRDRHARGRQSIDPEFFAGFDVE